MLENGTHVLYDLIYLPDTDTVVVGTVVLDFPPVSVIGAEDVEGTVRVEVTVIVGVGVSVGLCSGSE